jgi:hypothetical protein
MKLVAEKAEDLDIMDDPRPKDRVMWNRLRLVLEAELCHQAWGCKLYQMHREGQITLDAMRAGDKYHQAILDWRTWNGVDPEEWEPIRRQFLYGKIDRAKRKLKEFTDVIGILRNKYVEEIILYERWPAYHWQKRKAIEGLEDLGIFLLKGTKRKRQTANP